MGSWNKTCGLSNLHICSGDPVYVFVLEPNEHHDRCYTTALYKPVLLPFESVYNDYGGGEDSGGVGFNYIMEAIEKNLVEQELGANQYHDIEVKRENFDEGLFFEAVHENRLNVQHHGRFDAALDFVMMRKDIVDNLLDNYEIEKYVGSNKGTYSPYGGESKDYIKYKFADIVASLPKAIEIILGKDTEFNDLMKELPEEKRKAFKLLTAGFSSLRSQDENCLAAQWLQSDNYRYSRLVRVQDLVVDMIGEDDYEDLLPLLTDHLKALFIDAYMHNIRKVWAPGCHEGSQNSDHDPYRFLCNAITKVLDDADAKYAAEYED
jgi:hypothetical protein